MVKIKREIGICDKVSSIRFKFETMYDVNNTIYSDSLHIYYSNVYTLCKEEIRDREIGSMMADKKYLIFACDRQANKIYGNGIKIEKIAEDGECEIIEVEVESSIQYGNKSYFVKERKGTFDRIMDFFMEKR